MSAKHLYALGFMLCLVLISFSTEAYEITLTWDPSTSGNIAGYKIYQSNQSGNYTDNPIDAGSTTSHTIFGLDLNQAYYFVATAYDSYGHESGYSNEVFWRGTSSDNSAFFDTVQTSNNFTATNNYITGNVTDTSGSPKGSYWKKTNLKVNAGNLVTLQTDIYFDNGSTPISVYLIDSATGMTISKERVLQVSGNLKADISLPVTYDSDNATLVVACGHSQGNYEFANIEISAHSPCIKPTRSLYLSKLVPSENGYKYAARFKWGAVTEAEGYKIQIATTRQAIERPDLFQLYEEKTLSADQQSYDLDITQDLYNGVHLAVKTIKDNSFSKPQIISYLPGNILGHLDQSLPPLVSEVKVDTDDYYEAYYGYAYNWTVPDDGNELAGKEERMDIDNNGLAGRYDDFYFVKGQYGKSLLLE